MLIDFEKMSHAEVIECYSHTTKELKKREIVRTKNITGELGEYIAVDYYNKTPNLPNLQFAPPSTENIDAISRKGERYSIKTITNMGSTGVFYGLPPLEADEIPNQKFEYVVIVKLTDDFELERILELTWDEFLENKKWHSRMKAWNLSYSNKLIDLVNNIFKR
ncbi:MAG TPA: hypothetical protein EYH42_02640 [Sulfurovum sp.]|nr:hypothetical protein [Sulfurovum sp.]